MDCSNQDCNADLNIKSRNPEKEIQGFEKYYGLLCDTCNVNIKIHNRVECISCERLICIFEFIGIEGINKPQLYYVEKCISCGGTKQDMKKLLEVKPS